MTTIWMMMVMMRMMFTNDNDEEPDFVTLRKHVMNVHKGMPVEYVDLRKIMKENADAGNLLRMTSDAGRQADENTQVNPQINPQINP